MQQLWLNLQDTLSSLHIPSIRWTDLVEIAVIAIVIYHLMVWFKSSRAWALFRGLILIFFFVIIAVLFNMSTILWLIQNVTGIAVTALIIILQPEIRRTLEELGQRNLFGSFNPFDNAKETSRFSDHTMNEIIRATNEMARVKTGALRVLEQEISLKEYERTGIDIDAVVTSQLLINIFEKNTPLHDGAVLIRGDRVVSATCYLPLSENRLDKDLGTRHRAGVGISEVTDALTIIVSEETGAVSIAYKGELFHDISQADLKDRMTRFQNKTVSEERQGIGILSSIGRRNIRGRKNHTEGSGR